MAKSRREFSTAETSRNTGKESGLGEHEARPMDQEHLREQPDTDPDKRSGIKIVLTARHRIVGTASRQPPDSAS